MNKEYYLNFKTFITGLTKKEKTIKEDLESYKISIGNNLNTIESFDSILDVNQKNDNLESKNLNEKKWEV